MLFTVFLLGTHYNKSSEGNKPVTSIYIVWQRHLTYIRVTIFDEEKFRTQPFIFLSIGSRVGRVVTFGKKVVTFC